MYNGGIIILPDLRAQILGVSILLLFSAFFSAAETSFSALNRIRMKMLADDGNRRAAAVLELTGRYDRLLSAVLIGNNVVNIASTSVAAALFINMLGSAKGPTVATVVMTVLVLVFGEITPKTLAKESPEKFALAAAPLLRFVVLLLTPITTLFVLWKRLLTRVFRIDGQEAITGEELQSIVGEAESGGGIDEEEGRLIRSAIDFSEQTAAKVLTPRVDVYAVPADAQGEALTEAFRTSGFSRLPVYEGSLDKIVGVLHLRDLTPGRTAAEQMQKPMFITEGMSISTLLRIMQRERTHLAVVLDEYGGTCGIVTMEDILEELVGEIWDENDEIVEEFSAATDGRLRARGDAQVDKLFERLGLDLPEEGEQATVGGWVLAALGKTAREGDSFTHDGLSVTVTRVEQRRVREILVAAPQPAAE